jgi:hypothetical protein
MCWAPGNEVRGEIYLATVGEGIKQGKEVRTHVLIAQHYISIVLNGIAWGCIAWDKICEHTAEIGILLVLLPLYLIFNLSHSTNQPIVTTPMQPPHPQVISQCTRPEPLDRPLTFNRQVMAAMFAPFLLD